MSRTVIEVGAKAPAFQAKNQDGEDVRLSDFKGKKLILYFYPKDNTPGCTTEACDFRDNYQSLVGKGFEVVGVSADSEKSHANFVKKYKLPFHLISDPEHKIMDAYGAWGQKKFMGRTYDGIHRITYVIGEDGTVLERLDKVNTKQASAQVLDALSSN